MNLMERNYSTDFYAGQEGESARSAAIVVRYVTDVLTPKSVLDVGCGVGPWVRAFEDAGADVAHGLDGPWARQSGLMIGEESFCEFDFLKNPAPFRPAGLRDRYDLVTTFEFVEHLSSEYAPKLAEFFASKSDAVIIGCACPGQGGSHHVNEQWPSYWAKLMGEHGYEPCDFIRPAIWNDDRIMSWYRQNSVAYFKGGVPDHVIEQAKHEWAKTITKPLDLVHPATLNAKTGMLKPTVGNLSGMASRTVRSTIKTLIGRS